MGMRLTAWGAGILAVALIFSGCGGSDDSGSGKSISKEEFVAKADAICKKGNERMEKELFKFLRQNQAGGALRKPTVAQNEKFIVTVLIPNLEREIDEIKALGVPDGDDETIDAWIAALEEGLETAEDDTETVAAGTSDIVFGIASRLAGEYGAEVCGSR